MKELETEIELEETFEREELRETDGEALSRYLAEIGRIPLLSREEETELAEKAKKGDKSARDRLVKSNLRFVVSVAKRFSGQGLSLEDLIEEGNLGLIEASLRFDPDKGYHFISYAVWWVRQSIMKALSEKGRSVRLPLNRAGELVRIQRAEREITSSGRLATDRALSEVTGLTEEVVRDLMSAGTEAVSLDAPARGEEGSATVGDFQEYDAAGPEDALLSASIDEDVRGLLSALDERERMVIMKRYGIGGIEEKSLKEIGEELDLTKERIRQIEKKALSKMREEAMRRGMEDYARAV